MAVDQQPQALVPPSRSEPVAPAMIRGAELVVLAEELYLRLFMLALGFVVISAVLSVWFGVGSLAPLAVTVPFAVAGGAFGVAGLRRPRAVYCWLRYSAARQVTPALASAAAMLVTGPDSPLWWLSLALVIAVSSISSLRLSIAAATVSSAGYVGGTLLGGQQLLHGGNPGILPGAVGLVAYTLVGAFVCQAFARFVLGLRSVRDEPADEEPRRVPNIADPADAADAADHKPDRRPRREPARRSGHDSGRARSRTDGVASLTPRQLEAVLLIRDGLNQSEAAAALGISRRQVERLLSEARERASAATTSQLVAMIVTEELVGGRAR